MPSGIECPPKLPLLQSPSCSHQRTPTPRAFTPGELGVLLGQPSRCHCENGERNTGPLHGGGLAEPRPHGRTRPCPGPTKASTEEPRPLPHPTSPAPVPARRWPGAPRSRAATVASLRPDSAAAGSWRAPARQETGGAEARSAWRQTHGKRLVPPAARPPSCPPRPPTAARWPSALPSPSSSGQCAGATSTDSPLDPPQLAVGALCWPPQRERHSPGAR